MSKIPDLKTLALRDTAFADLMQKRIYSILLVATRYDSFILEDDGRVDEQIYNEYNALSLSSPPRITQVLTTEEALDLLRYRHFDLIICIQRSKQACSHRKHECDRLYIQLARKYRTLDSDYQVARRQNERTS